MRFTFTGPQGKSGRQFKVTDHPLKTLPQFYVTAPAPCPYLPGRTERKIFAHLLGDSARVIHDSLTAAGFRRSQHIAYKPACGACNACVSVRVPVAQRQFSRSQKRNLSLNSHLIREPKGALASAEQFELLRSYLKARHPEGGMAEMGPRDYAAMVEETPIATGLVEYRHTCGKLVGCTLMDRLSDGLSMVYSFYDPHPDYRGLGTFMVLDHMNYVAELGLDYLYLGYWVEGCRKMDYKRRFRPLETLGPNGWQSAQDTES